MVRISSIALKCQPYLHIQRILHISSSISLTHDFSSNIKLSITKLYLQHLDPSFPQNYIRSIDVVIQYNRGFSLLQVILTYSTIQHLDLIPLYRNYLSCYSTKTHFHHIHRKLHQNRNEIMASTKDRRLKEIVRSDRDSQFVTSGNMPE